MKKEKEISIPLLIKKTTLKRGISALIAVMTVLTCTSCNRAAKYDRNEKGSGNDIKETADNAAASGGETEADALGNLNVTVGDYFQMGTYYGEPILWRCIKVDENGPLMLSDKILCIKPFDVSGTNTSGSHGRGLAHSETAGYFRQTNGSNCWGDSNIRDWLNSDASAGNVIWSCGNPPDKDHVWNSYNAYDQEAGFLNGFTSGEKSAIKTVTQKQLLDGYEYSSLINADYHIFNSDINDVLQNYDTAYCETTTDKMFLLDVKQAYDLYKDFGDYYMAYCTSKAVENGDSSVIAGTDSRCNYWLRSPGAYSYSDYVRVITPSGDVDYHSANRYDVGVRPAFYLNTESANVSVGSGSENDPYVLSGDWNVKDSK